MRTIPLLFLPLALAACGGGESNGQCPGVCAPAASSDWIAYLVWFGSPDATPPACPSELPNPAPGWAETEPSVQCAPCNCGPSSGSCILPQQMSASAGASCTGTTMPFDAPADWNGACTAMDPLPAAASLDVPPPFVMTGQCMGSSADPISVKGTTRAVVCILGGIEPVMPACPNAADMCTYAPVDGFSVCLFQFGVVDCPAGWTDRHLDWVDQEDCNCTCGPATGDSCSSTLTVYSDGACADPIGSATVSSTTGDQCIDTAAGSSFGSKSATSPAYVGGTCQATLIPDQVATVCCLPGGGTGAGGSP